MNGRKSKGVLLSHNKRSKVFICDDKFADIKSGLIKRGWTTNAVLGSPAYDFKWRNYRNINFRLLRHSQVINHLFNAVHLSTKALLACHLQGTERQVDQPFFPRSWLPFRPSHLSDLLHHVALTRAYSCLTRAFKRHSSQSRQQSPDQPSSVQDALACCQFYLDYLDRKDGGDMVAAAFVLPRALLRRLLRSDHDADGEEKGGAADEDGDCNGAAVDEERVDWTLDAMRRRDRHFMVYEDTGTWPDGCWIIKPCGGSCGRDIKVVASLPSLIEELSSRNFDCVVQKYIDRPLLLHGRKFDIRLWVLVTSVNPLVVWEFSECYLRLSTKPFAPSDLEDAFVHLCNYAIQKNHPDYEVDPMWTSSRFRAYLQDRYDRDVYTDNLRPAIRKLVVDTLTNTQEILERRARGFEWLGLDIMVDEVTLQPWLIEVNVSPDVSHSTAVTTTLVQAATTDLLHMLFDEGCRDGDLGGITSLDGLPPHRLSPELMAQVLSAPPPPPPPPPQSPAASQAKQERESTRRQHQRQTKGGEKEGDKVKQATVVARGESCPKGPCWRVWHMEETLTPGELEATRRQKGSAEWEALIRKEKAAALQPGGESELDKVLGSLLGPEPEECQREEEGQRQKTVEEEEEEEEEARGAPTGAGELQQDDGENEEGGEWEGVEEDGGGWTQLK